MNGPVRFQHGLAIGSPPLVRTDAQGQHIDAGSTQGARFMICGHRWTSHKAKAPFAGSCDDAGFQPDISLAWIEKNVPYTAGPMKSYLEGWRKVGLQ
jgi:hypothetical protein